MQQHLRVCINNGRSLILSVQQLTEEQLLACQDPKPTSEEWLEERHECQLCGENLKSAEFLQNHVDSHLTPIAGEIKCAFGNKCSLVFSCAETLKEHRKEHYKAMQFSCEVCGKHFLHKCNIKKHMVCHFKERSFLCGTAGCLFMGKTKLNLQRHMISKHCNVITTCHLCGKKLKADCLKKHYARHETGTPGVLKCLYLGCKKLFQKVDNLKKHTEQVHQVEKKFQCRACGKWFASKSNFKSHLRRYSNLKPFKCFVAGCCYLGRTAPVLKAHCKKEHTLQYCTCIYCGKEYKKQFALKQHVKNHMTDVDGVFKCVVPGCKETFSKVQQLRKHVKKKDSHESIKRFECKVCGKWYADKSTVRKHLWRHSKLKNLKCDVTGCSFSGKTAVALRNHSIHMHKFQYFTCAYCGNKFTKKYSRNKHVKNHMTDVEGVFKCLVAGCRETFSEVEQLRKHVQRSDSHESVKKFACKVCGQINPNKLLLDIHMLKQHQVGKCACPVPGCTFLSNTLTRMHLHRVSAHLVSFENTCKLCGQGCYSAAQFQQHTEAHKTPEEEIIKCLFEECLETFSDPLHLRTHMKQHGNIHECDVPDCLFASSSEIELQLHKISTHSIWPHNCNICGKGFEQFHKLKSHLKYHVTDVTDVPVVYRCLNCKETFTSEAELKKHVEIHKETPPKVTDSSVLTLQSIEDPNSKAECSLCGKILTRLFLKQHILKHSTQTPGFFKCIFKGCNLTFTSTADLKEHASIKHWDFSKSKERPLECVVPGCKMSFKYNSNLQRHKRTVHSPTAWTCHLCGKNYKDVVYGVRHIRTAHADQQQCMVNPSPIVQVFLPAQEQELCKEEAEDPSPIGQVFPPAHEQELCKEEAEEVVFD